MTEDEKLKRIEGAERLLSSGSFQTLMEELEAEQIEQFMASFPDQIGLREEAYHMMRALKAIRDRLKSIADERSVNEKREAARKLHS